MYTPIAQPSVYQPAEVTTTTVNPAPATVNSEPHSPDSDVSFSEYELII